jgi:hypothetical protein
MHTSIGKPVVALVSAACLSAPAALPTVAHQLAPVESHMAVHLSAATTALTPRPVDPVAAEAAIDSLATLSGVDKATLLLQLLTAPYHNVVGISKAVGSAANAGLQLVSLPFSIASFVIANQTDQIPKYIETVQANLKGALPGIRTAIQSEIEYDKNLFAQFFGGSDTPNALTQDAAHHAATGAADPVNQGTLILQLLTIPYHNFVGVSKAVGTAANAGLQLVSLPFSIATFVLTNQADQIPKYVETVQNNLKTALPGIQTAIKAEAAYNKNVFSQLFGGSPTTQTALTVNARETPNLLADNTNTSESETSTTVDKDSKDTSDTGTAETKKPNWAEKLADRIAERKAAKETEDAGKSDPSGDASDGTTQPVTTEPSKTEPSKTEPSKTEPSEPGSSKTETSKTETGGKHRKPDAA